MTRAEVGTSLAVVTSSPAPLLLLDGQLTVIAASTSFCDVLGVDVGELTGQPLYTLDSGEWDGPELRPLITATVSGETMPSARDIDLKRPRRSVRHLIVQARRLAYLDLDQTRILVAVSDVTDARKTTSDETRGHLKDAHHRVMSVAALERMLSTSQDGDIEVQAYFTSLCENISASMIGEVDRISLSVEGGQGVVEARSR